VSVQSKVTKRKYIFLKENQMKEKMNKVRDLGFLFAVVAVVEWIYAIIGVFTPPSLILPLTGWMLTADGQWLAKLLGMALASQAWVAWTLRKEPHLGVAKALAFYQIASATVDWVMWIVLLDQGIFSTTAARVGVLVAIPTHYLLGLLLVLAIRNAAKKEPK
jgi:hypothetical protein